MKLAIFVLAVLIAIISLVEASALPELHERSPKGGNRQSKGGSNKDKSNTTVDAASTTTDAAVAAATTDATSTSATQDESNGGSVTCLAAGALQTGSEQDGQSGNVTAGQVPSQTDDANFINVCNGQTLTNGKQVVTGSCNGIPLGFIPAKTQMPSSIITFPQHNQDLPANQSFDITILTANMDLGFFTNAELTYYSAPTQLNSQGVVIGHTHITCQDLGGSFDPTAPLNSATFAFFLGINTPADQNGQVKATVPNGLPPGFYRCCTMVANANHSPLQMPVAQRGAQDDCKYFSVGQSAGDAGTGQQAVASSAAADPPTSTTSAAASTKTGKGGKGGKNRGGKQRI